MMAELDTGKLKGGELRRRMAELLREGKTVPFQEVYSLPPQRRPQTPDFSRIKDPAARKRAEERFKAQAKRRRNNNRPATGKLLGGDVLDLNEYTDPREPLMEWLRAEPNFAKAFVNRVWASYFNRGIVDPPDNLSLANPPVNAELLDYLAQGFVDHGFDMKWLHREITNSDTYQRSWRPNETNRLDERNFSRAVPRRLPAEVAVDAIAQATSGDQRAQAMTTTLTGRAIAIPGAGRRVRTNRDAAYALTIFGRSVRESNCDCDRSMEPSLLQTVFLMNDDRTLAMIDGRGSWLEQIAKAAGVPFTPKAQAGGQGSNANRRQRQLRQQMTQLQNQIRKLSKQQGKEKQVAKLRRQLNQLRQRVAGNANPASQADDTGQGPATTSVDPQVIVRDAYLRTLSRLPTDDETQVALGHLRQASDIVSGSRDLLWALLNTKEFIVNH